jgi:DNA polymerase III epsilon subunit-like protein
MTAPLVLLGAEIPAAPAVVSRVVRLTSHAGLSLPPKPKPQDLTASLAAFREELLARRVRLLWDGRAFLLEHRPEDLGCPRDIDTVTLLFDELCADYAPKGVRLPPAVEAAAVDDELSAGCYHAWRVTRELRALGERSRDEEREEAFQPVIESVLSAAEQTHRAARQTAKREVAAQESARAEQRNGAPLCFLDLEHTGQTPAQARVIQLAFRLRRREVSEEHWASYLTNERVPILPGAFRVHRLRETQLRGKPTFAQVLPEILPRFRGAILVAHNAASCDVPHLRASFARAGVAWPFLDVLDTLRLAKALVGGPCKVSDLLARFGLRGGREHDAAGDVESLLSIWGYLRSLVPDATVADLFQLLSAATPQRAPAKGRQCLQATIATLTPIYGPRGTARPRSQQELGS